MFKHIKEFFKTLFMEFKGVKTHAVSFHALAVVKDFSAEGKNINVHSEELSVRINKILVSPSVKLHDLRDESEIHVKRDDLIGRTCSCHETTLPSLNDSVKTFNTNFQTTVISKNPVFRSKVVEGVHYRMNVYVGNDMGHIRIMRIKREKKIDKNKVLDTLARFLSDYKGSLKDFEFVGYYRSVPIGHVEKISVSKRDLMILLKKKGRNLKVDILLIKLKGMYKIIPVRD